MRWACAIILLVSISNPASSQSYVCVEEASSGFDWHEGQWQRSNFTPKQYVISKAREPSAPVEFCFDDLKQNDHPTSRSQTDTNGRTFGCYFANEIGQAPSVSHLCTERGDINGEIQSIDCSGMQNFKLAPGGEFVFSQTYPAPDIPDPTAQRDSLVLAIGKCSTALP
jgi:hypothetical protein